MTREQSFFIQILSDHLNGRETERIDGLDWPIIYQYARKHQVSGIVYTQAKDIMPIDVLPIFRQDTLATFYYASNRDSDFETIKKELLKNNIPFFVVKGPAVAELFPIPKLRAMGDIDLVVSHEYCEKCHEILLENGYRCATKQDEREWQYYKHGMELELHDRLVYEETVNETGHDTYFNDCWKYVKEGQLDWNFHLLFLIFHLRKHFMNAGVGFRQFMDLAVVAQKIDIDWEWVEENLKITGMYPFAKKCYGFVDQMFGIKTPLAEGLDADFAEDAIQTIFSNGVFGFDNADNKTSASINEVRKSKHPRLSLFYLYLKEVFPPWELLSKTKSYGYLQKSKYLLPIAWLHRLCRNIQYALSKGKLKGKKIASMENYDHRMDWMKNWGLLDEDNHL